MIVIKIKKMMIPMQTIMENKVGIQKMMEEIINNNKNDENKLEKKELILAKQNYIVIWKIYSIYA